MKKIGFLLLILISAEVSFAQTLDEDRMNRDLEVAKNILSTLMKGESDGYFGGGSAIEASYVTGYGVIFTVPKHYVYFNARPPKPPRVRAITVAPSTGSYVIVDEVPEVDVDTDIDWNVEADQDEEDVVSAKERAARDAKRAERDRAMAAEQEKRYQAQEEKMKEQMAMLEKESALIEAEAKEWESNYTKQMEIQSQKWEQAMITFLADYADLIGQLKPDEKIMIKQESPFDEYVFVWNNDSDIEQNSQGALGLSMEVSKKDITAYKNGTLSLDKFKEKVITKKKEPQKKQADLEMFANIFKQYYSPKLSKTFFTEGTPTYEILDNFGAIFNIKTYSSYVEGNLYYMPVLGDEKVSPDQRKETIEGLYPKFEADLKSFIVDYGRTIRSLDDNDMLLLKVRMTRCDECEIPKSIDVSIKMSALKQFDQQKISREKAMSAIEIKKNSN